MVRCGSDYLRGQPEERALPLFLDTGFEGFEGVTRRPPVAGVSWCRGSSLFAVLVDSTNAAGTQSTRTPSASSRRGCGLCNARVLGLVRNLFEREFLGHKSIQHQLFESLTRARAGEPSAFCNRRLDRMRERA